MTIALQNNLGLEIVYPLPIAPQCGWGLEIVYSLPIAPQYLWDLEIAFPQPMASQNGRDWRLSTHCQQLLSICGIWRFSMVPLLVYLDVLILCRSHAESTAAVSSWRWELCHGLIHRTPHMLRLPHVGLPLFFDVSFSITRGLMLMFHLGLSLLFSAHGPVLLSVNCCPQQKEASLTKCFNKNVWDLL